MSSSLTHQPKSTNSGERLQLSTANSEFRIFKKRGVDPINEIKSKTLRIVKYLCLRKGRLPMRCDFAQSSWNRHRYECI